jgi:lipid II:glycine glycyltransferase (peptidoglycan interpeptide bridge formation enzyme)
MLNSFNESVTASSEAGYTVEIDRISRKEWNEYLQSFDDANIYQTWEYASARWGDRNTRRFVLHRNSEVVSIAQLRIVRPTSLNLGLGQLRWGPLCHRKGTNVDSEALRYMATAIHQECVLKQRLFLRLLPNAFSQTSRAAEFSSAFSNFKLSEFAKGESYRTILLDLDPPLDALRKKLDQKWRNQLNRAEKNKIHVSLSSSDEAFELFPAIYQEMWERKKITQASSLNDYIAVQPQLVNENKLITLIATVEGHPAAGVVASAMGDSAIYLLGATNEFGMKSKASYLLHWRLIQWLKEKGISYYNLGGINPETNPGVYHFKSGFGGNDVTYSPPLIASGNLFSSLLARIVAAKRSLQLRR